MPKEKLMTEQHFTAACAFYLALASQMRRSGHIKVANHADKQYRTYRNRLESKSSHSDPTPKQLLNK